MTRFVMITGGNVIGFKFVFVLFSLFYIEGFVCKLFASEVSDYWGECDCLQVFIRFVFSSLH